MTAERFIFIVVLFCFAGLDGRTTMDRVKADMIIETVRGIIEPIAEIFNEQNEQTKVCVIFSSTSLTCFCVLI